MTTASAKIQFGAAGLAVALTAAFTPMIAQADTFSLAPELAPTGQVLTWGYDQLDSVLIAQINDAAGPSAAAVGANATAGPIATLLQYLVEGIAKGVRDVVTGVITVGGTITYVTLAFTGGVITRVGDILPGPLGNLLVTVGDGVTKVANNIAEAIHVGPYGTATT